MPIKHAESGHFVQRCGNCGADNKHTFNKGADKTKNGPFALVNLQTLTLKVDGGSVQTVTFITADFADINNATATEVAARINTDTTGCTASVDDDGVLIESDSTGSSSRVEITGGTAAVGLGFTASGTPNRLQTRPVIGFDDPLGDNHKDYMQLRLCNNCGSLEYLLRNLEACHASHAHAGNVFYDQRRAVNSIAKHCITNSWTHPSSNFVGDPDPADLYGTFPGAAIDPTLP
jgi:hypothetical protein